MSCVRSSLMAGDSPPAGVEAGHLRTRPVAGAATSVFPAVVVVVVVVVVAAAAAADTAKQPSGPKTDLAVPSPQERAVVELMGS
jgi:hypothetical protein